MSDRTPGGAFKDIAPYASPGRAGRPGAGVPREFFTFSFIEVAAGRPAAFRAAWDVEGHPYSAVIIPTYNRWLDVPHMLWDAFRDWARELWWPTIHLRYDDSRRRGLASECICGEPGCTRWYGPFQEDGD